MTDRELIEQVEGGAPEAPSTRRVVLIRVADQGAWSGGFFLLNAVAGFTMRPEEYAALSVSTALAFVAVAAMRSWGVYSLLVWAGRERVDPTSAVDARSGWFAAVVIGVIAAVTSGLWVGQQVVGGFVFLCAGVAAAIVVSDLPRQLLVARGIHTRTFALSGVYLVGAAVVAATVATGSAGSGVIVPAWIVILALVAAVGLVVDRPRARGRFDRRERMRVGWRLTAESLYLAAGSQVGLLLLFTLHDPVATSGFRFAYSLIFAPAFVVIQGLQPVMLRQVASRAAPGPSAAARLAARWSLSQGVLLIVVGAVAGTVLLLAVDAPGPRAALPFIIPLGLSIISAQTFESVFLAYRFFVDPRVVHRARLLTVLLDVASQAVGVAVWGPTGLAVALVVFATVRLSVSGIGLATLRRRPTDADARGRHVR
ncbi:hypothetical protein [Williamsia sp.]|uniref:hypothetical protein n=1 Tax=Williamsia sp. TaxID=1872085 RepID=UPI001A20AB50|nr:hypothetical protein [Williamsia sp.]MBJ7289750.1 hypothetical protein [Williamsia sp.]